MIFSTFLRHFLAQNHRILVRKHQKNMETGCKEQVGSPLLLGQSLQPDMRWLSTPRDRKIYLVFQAIFFMYDVEKYIQPESEFCNFQVPD